MASSVKPWPPDADLSPSVNLDGPLPAASVERKPARFLFVDALRGIAALWVVIYHAYSGDHLKQVTSRLPGWALVFFESGHLGVPIFFVLSGFVIAHSISRHTVNLPFVGRFALRRSIRLDPPYWASIALIIGFGILSKIAIPSKSHDPPGMGQILAHLFYVQEILGYPEINPIYWTLALEIQFYLVFCSLMALVHATRRDPADRRSLFVIFVPAFLFAATWPLGLLKGNLWPGLFPPHWHGFLLGTLACWAMNGTVGSVWFCTYAVLVGVGAAWTANLFSGACVATSTLLLVAARADGLGTWLGWRWLQFLGFISYSLYLIHNPISGALYHIGFRITGRSPATEVFWFCSMIATNIAVAAAAWWLIERPSLALAHRVRMQPR